MARIVDKVEGGIQRGLCEWAIQHPERVKCAVGGALIGVNRPRPLTPRYTPAQP